MHKLVSLIDNDSIKNAAGSLQDIVEKAGKVYKQISETAIGYIKGGKENIFSDAQDDHELKCESIGLLGCHLRI